MYIDILLLCVVLILLGLGVKKGFILEFFSLFGLFICVFLSKKFGPLVYSLIFSENMKELNGKNSPDAIKFIIFYVITFLILYIILFLILLITKKFFQAIFLGWIDRIAGGVVGLLKGIVISLVMLVVLIVLANFNNGVKIQLNTSYSMSGMEKIYPSIIKFFPKEFEKLFSNVQKEIEVDDILTNLEMLKSKDFKGAKDIEKKIDKIIEKAKEGKDDKEINELIEKALNDKDIKGLIEKFENNKK